MPEVNRRSFSGTNAQRVGSGGGADVTALNSLPGYVLEMGEMDAGKYLHTDDIMREVVEIEIVPIIAKGVFKEY